MWIIDLNQRSNVLLWSLLINRLTQLTVRELWVAELQIFARPGGVVLRAHRIFHSFDVLFKIVERAKDVLHALAVVHDGCIRLHVTGPFALLGWLDWQRLNDLAWWTLRMEEEKNNSSSHRKTYNVKVLAYILTGSPGGPIEPVSPFGPAGPWNASRLYAPCRV